MFQQCCTDVCPDGKRSRARDNELLCIYGSGSKGGMKRDFRAHRGSDYCKITPIHAGPSRLSAEQKGRNRRGQPFIIDIHLNERWKRKNGASGVGGISRSLLSRDGARRSSRGDRAGRRGPGHLCPHPGGGGGQRAKRVSGSCLRADEQPLPSSLGNSASQSVPGVPVAC